LDCPSNRERWRREGYPVFVKTDETDQVRVYPIFNGSDFNVVNDFVTDDIIASGIREECSEGFGAFFNRG
jgi:hypothetical protein